MAARSSAVALQKLYPVNPLAAIARIRSARERFVARNISSMLIEILYGGGPIAAEGTGVVAVLRCAALTPKGARTLATSNSRRVREDRTAGFMAFLRSGRG